MAEILTYEEKEYKHHWLSKPIRYVIDGNGCWNCVSHYRPPNCYPKTKRNGEATTVPRYIFEQEVEPIKDGNLVLHHCDNRKCINPEHLYHGTYKDNGADMVKRNRAVRGEEHYKAKLTKKDVAKIRIDKRSIYELARIYPVSPAHISRIKRRESWKEVAVNE